MECIEVKQFKEKIKHDAKSVTFTDCRGKNHTLIFGYQKTGYGQKRFFLCPKCSKRVTRLYYSDGAYYCRECVGTDVYKGIKNMTKGGSNEIAYRMKKYAYEHDITFDFPFDYMQFINDKRTRKQSFLKQLAVLQGLENMRFQAIMSKTTYSSKVLSSVCRGKHPLLSAVTLYDLKNWFYDWNTGKQIIVYNARSIIR